MKHADSHEHNGMSEELDQHHSYRRKSDVQKEAHHDSKLELNHAQREVESNRLRVEDAINQIENKLQDGQRKVQSLVYNLRAPERFARARPLETAALFVVAGFAIGAWLVGRFGGSVDREHLESFDDFTGGREGFRPNQAFPNSYASSQAASPIYGAGSYGGTSHFVDTPPYAMGSPEAPYQSRPDTESLTGPSVQPGLTSQSGRSPEDYNRRRKG